MTEIERHDRIENIRTLPDEIEAVVRGLNERQLDTPYGEGKWTVRQVVHHVADSHMNAYIRMKLIMTEDVPTLKPYDQDEWAKLHDAQKLPVETSLSLIRGLHERWCGLMQHLPEDAWRRKGRHPEHGDLSMEGILTIYAKHGKNHVQQIQNLRTARKW